MNELRMMRVVNQQKHYDVIGTGRRELSHNILHWAGIPIEKKLMGCTRTYRAVDILKVTHKGAERGDAACLSQLSCQFVYYRLTESAGWIAIARDVLVRREKQHHFTFLVLDGHNVQQTPEGTTFPHHNHHHNTVVTLPFRYNRYSKSAIPFYVSRMFL